MISKRLYCPDCELPEKNCICHLRCAIDNPVELLALQHPLEVDQSKNSLRLLRISSKNMQMKIGEEFDQEELNQWLYADHKTPLLLYPESDYASIQGLIKPAVLPDLTEIPLTELRLVILDATWKKSRKMIYLNPGLQKLPRLTLIDPPPSIYTIRKSHSQNQLSSLEACCYAWRQLENNPPAYDELIKAFAGFVHQQHLLIETQSL